MKITRRQLKQLILEEMSHHMRVAYPSMEESGAYPTSDDTDAGYINAVLDELKEDFIQKMWPTVEKMEWETDKGIFTDSNEELVMEALADFDKQAGEYRAQVKAALNGAEINDGTTPKMPMSASRTLAWMMGVTGTGASDAVNELVSKFDQILSGGDIWKTRSIIERHNISF